MIDVRSSMPLASAMCCSGTAPAVGDTLRPRLPGARVSRRAASLPVGRCSSPTTSTPPMTRASRMSELVHPRAKSGAMSASTSLRPQRWSRSPGDSPIGLRGPACLSGATSLTDEPDSEQGDDTEGTIHTQARSAPGPASASSTRLVQRVPRCRPSRDCRRSSRRLRGARPTCSSPTTSTPIASARSSILRCPWATHIRERRDSERDKPHPIGDRVFIRAASSEQSPVGSRR